MSYWRNEEETNRTLKNGWLYTRDLPRMDEDGYFYIVGRKKNLLSQVVTTFIVLS